jgi:hypothetical protein
VAVGGTAAVSVPAMIVSISPVSEVGVGGSAGGLQADIQNPNTRRTNTEDFISFFFMISQVD